MVGHFLSRYKYRNEEKSSFLSLFFGSDCFSSRGRSNFGEDYFIQCVSFFGTRKKDEYACENHFLFCLQPSGNKKPSDYFLSKTVVVTGQTDAVTSTALSWS